MATGHHRIPVVDNGQASQTGISTMPADGPGGTMTPPADMNVLPNAAITMTTATWHTTGGLRPWRTVP